MTEQFISKTRVAAVAGWILAGLFAAAAVTTVAVTHEPRGWAMMLAMAACISAVAAGTLSVKVYVMRLCALVRVTSGLDGVDNVGRELTVIPGG